MKYLLLSIILLIGGCSSKGMGVAPKNTPIEYQDGFSDGCDSGYSAAGNPYYKYSKDVVRGQTDSLYKEGWTDGYNMCHSRYEHTKSLIR